jgi:hypothetical protein
MYHAVFYDVPADEEFYRRVMTEIGDEQPKGLVVHLVVKRDGGLRHTEVWESKEDWERFRQEQVEPALDKVFAAAGFAQRPPRPMEHQMQVVDVRTGI